MSKGENRRWNAWERSGPCIFWGSPFAGTVQAETDRAALDEIVVTARRIEERLADVPLSVTVIGGLQLDEFAVTRWEDLTLPGIKIGPPACSTSVDRGIASGLNFGFEQSAPIFVDGVWFSSSRASRSGFVDLERIEILKGPQPTHFGKNAIAGALASSRASHSRSSRLGSTPTTSSSTKRRPSPASSIAGQRHAGRAASPQDGAISTAT